MVWLAGEVLWQNAWYAPFLTFAALQVFTLLSHLSLLDNTGRGAATRLALLLPSLYLIIDLVFNTRYRLGSPMRDLAFGVMGWHLLAKALDVGIVYGMERKPGPRWCVPDWEKEAKRDENDKEVQSKEQSREAQPPFWKRSGIPSRPKWAAESNFLPSHWRLLPLPTRGVDCLVWAIDVMTLRRPGSSLLFPSEMRALEWSQQRLEKAGAAARKGKGSSKDGVAQSQRVDPTMTSFGTTETPPLDALLELVAVIGAVGYVSSLDIPAGPASFYTLPMVQQLLISTSMGVLVSFSSDFAELIAFPILQSWPLCMPCTALIPHFRSVARSKSLTELWGTRWHAFSKRDFLRLSRLLPFAPRVRAMTVLKSFFWSAVFHSFLFVRVRPYPTASEPMSLFNIFYLPGSFALFLGQGLLVVVENALSVTVGQSEVFRRWKSAWPALWSALQSLYVYGALTWSARWLVAELVPLGLLTHDAIHAMAISNQWRDYSSFWMDR